MVKIYILIEQATGYGLLKANDCKSTDDLLNKLKERNLSSLTKDFKLIEFQPFYSSTNAASNCENISNGQVSEDLEKLLKSHLNDGKCLLVVNDKKLLESLKSKKINSELTFNADNNTVFNLRFIRHNFYTFINVTENYMVNAQIGMGHSYSRIKIKYNVNRSDNMIIQTINLLDQMDKDINTMAMRLREWFGYHYPELFKIVPDYKMYAKIVQLVKSRSGVSAQILDTLESILQDSTKAQMIIDTAKTSMGYELTDEDFVNIAVFADKIIAMIEQREYTIEYLNKKMNTVAPNFSTLVGDIVAARLISHAGSLINLAKFPASTIQILGAEKALFRAIKSRGNTPKYGLIFHSSFIGRAAKGDKGRISRFLAAKISLAVRLDCFMDEPVNIFGQHLKKHVEDQLVYLETGKEPKKNYEVMEEAVKDAKEFVANIKKTIVEKSNSTDLKKSSEKELVIESITKKEKKSKKRKSEDANVITEKVENQLVNNQSEDIKKKNKKRKTEEIVQETEEKPVTTYNEVIGENIKKEKKKKRKTEGVQEEKPESVAAVPIVEEKINEIVKKEKKNKKRKPEEVNKPKVVDVVVAPNVNVNGELDESVKKDKKKKIRKTEEASEAMIENLSVPVESNVVKSEEKKKKLKKEKKDKVEKQNEIAVEKTDTAAVVNTDKSNIEKEKKSKKKHRESEVNVNNVNETPKKKKVKQV